MAPRALTEITGTDRRDAFPICWFINLWSERTSDDSKVCRDRVDEGIEKVGEGGSEGKRDGVKKGGEGGENKTDGDSRQVDKGRRGKTTQGNMQAFLQSGPAKKRTLSNSSLSMRTRAQSNAK